MAALISTLVILSHSVNLLHQVEKPTFPLSAYLLFNGVLGIVRMLRTMCGFVIVDMPPHFDDVVLALLDAKAALGLPGEALFERFDFSFGEREVQRAVLPEAHVGLELLYKLRIELVGFRAQLDQRRRLVRFRLRTENSGGSPRRLAWVASIDDGDLEAAPGKLERAREADEPAAGNGHVHALAFRTKRARAEVVSCAGE